MPLSPLVYDLFTTFAYYLREYGLEFTSGRYYAKYLGVVTDTDDPQGQGRVKVTCKAPTGRDDELTRWAYPSAEYAGQDKGIYFPPDEDDRVWVWFDHGDPTQPRYSGSFWTNPTQTKERSTSQVPAEFQRETGGPTTRGIKTKRGHGLLFEDDPDAGAKVELWTGEQETEGQPATRHHEIKLLDADDEKSIVITTTGGHETKWNDVSGAEGVTVETTGGFFHKILDYAKKIEMGGPAGFKFTLDEQSGIISLETPAGKKVEINETASTVTTDDGTGNSVVMSPAGVAVSSASMVNVQAAGAATITAAGAATIAAGGAMAITGAGMAIASTGGAPSVQTAAGVTNNTFVGLKTEVLMGGLVQTILGLWQMTSTIIDIVAPTIKLGTPGVKYALIDERLISYYNDHTHKLPSAIAFPPDPTELFDSESGPPLIEIGQPATPVKTSAVTAN